MVPSTMLSSFVLRTQPDERLVELTAGGSEAAFEVIVQRYRRELLTYCSRLLLDARAEDSVQQTFLAAWSALRTGAEVRQLRPWLYRIAHNHAISALRRPGWGFAELTEQISGGAFRDDGLERRMLMRETLAAVAALSDAQREVILRTAVEGETYAEAAAAMGLSDTAVRGLVHRARTNLRAAVAIVTPTPLVFWAAGAARRHSGMLSALSDTATSTATTGAGAGAGAAAVAAKSAAILASSAAVLGGGLATTHTSLLTPDRHHIRHQVTRTRTAPRERAVAAAGTLQTPPRHPDATPRRSPTAGSHPVALDVSAEHRTRSTALPGMSPRWHRATSGTGLPSTSHRSHQATAGTGRSPHVTLTQRDPDASPGASRRLDQAPRSGMTRRAAPSTSIGQSTPPTHPRTTVGWSQGAPTPSPTTAMTARDATHHGRAGHAIVPDPSGSTASPATAVSEVTTTPTPTPTPDRLSVDASPAGGHRRSASTAIAG